MTAVCQTRTTSLGVGMSGFAGCGHCVPHWRGPLGAI